MKLALLALPIAVAAAIALSPPANADPTPEERLHSAMADAGVDLWGNGQYEAIRICMLESTGLFTNTELAYGVLEANPTWSYSQAATFVTVAQYIYCSPEEARFRA